MTDHDSYSAAKRETEIPTNGRKDDEAKRIISRFEALESSRGEWEAKWRQCSDFVYPRSGQGNRLTKGNQDNRFQHEPTAEAALERFGAALESVLTPRTQKWHSLSTGYDDLDRKPEVAQWLEAVRDVQFKARYAPAANFANQMTEAWLSLGVHGTAVIFIDDRLGEGLRYQCISIFEIYLEENSVGLVDTVFRAYTLTARQARQEFGDQLPDNILKEAEDPAKMETPHEFIHAVMPRADAGAGAKGDFPIVSYHLAKAARKIVRQGGYRTMPYAVSRFSTMPGQVYGRSPTMKVMPYITQLNSMEQTILRSAEGVVNPPVLAMDDEFIAAWSNKPGAINYGGLDAEGRPRLVPFQSGGNIPIGLEMENQRREAINDAFFINLFQILVQKDGDQTATEVIARAQEKAQLLAPTMGRQQSELLRVIIERELDILQAGGSFDPIGMPEILAQDQPDIVPRYETPMAKALDAQDGEAILRALQGLGALAQFDQGILFRVNGDAAAKKIWESFGAPESVLRSDEEVRQIMAEQKEQQEMRMMMEQAQMAGAAGKDLSAAASQLAAAEAQAQGVREPGGLQ